MEKWGKGTRGGGAQTFVPQRLSAATTSITATTMTGELDAFPPTEQNAKSQIGHHRNNQPQHHRSHRATLTSPSQANRALTGIPTPHLPSYPPGTALRNHGNPPPTISVCETGRHSATSHGTESRGPPLEISSRSYHRTYRPLQSNVRHDQAAVNATTCDFPCSSKGL